MKPTVYIETSVISYLTSRPSRDLIAAARQEVTQRWWEDTAQAFELVTSEIVTLEASRGDLDAAQQRIAALSGCKILDVSEAARLPFSMTAYSRQTQGQMPSTLRSLRSIALNSYLPGTTSISQTLRSEST